MKSFSVLILIACGFGVAMPAAVAQNYPAKPVRWIVPFPPGGGTDLISRTLAAKLSETWNVQVVADNRPGGGGTIGMGIAAKTPADGYTLVLGQASNVTVAPGLYYKISYDPVKDLQPLTQVISTPLVIVSHPSFPAKSIRELVVYAKSKPDAVTFGSPGNGTIGHLALEYFKASSQVAPASVPYKGDTPALTDLLGGRLSLMFANLTTVQPHIKSGRVRALAIGTAQRSLVMPELPTVAEAGVPGYEANNWNGVVAPAGVPRAVIDRLQREIHAIVETPVMRERLLQNAFEPVADAPAAFARYLDGERVKWSRVVREAGIKPE